MFKKITILTAVAMLALAGLVFAKNVDLVTLPDREGVTLTIYNSADLTLVREVRYLSIKKGMNELQFSWHGTLIDPTSVEFRPLEHKDEIDVAHTVFPGQKPSHLIWHVMSRYEGQVKVEVLYFTSGLTWTMDYVATTNPDESKMKFDGYVRVFNRSGEEYENANIRLIVGKINLVEKIEELARRRGIPVPVEDAEMLGRMKKEALRKSMDRAAGFAEAAPNAAPMKEKKIVKEGLSEYFMFSIDGTETVKNGWSKRMRAVKAEDVKFDIVYRMRAHQYGARPVKFFVWKNDDEHELGESPLPDGRVRIFRENGNNGLSYLGEQNVNYVPVKADIEINLGPDDLVVYETVKMEVARNNFIFAQRGRQWDRKDYVTGWDDHQKWIDKIRNYRDKPIKFELRRMWHGDVEYSSEMETKLFDYRTIEATFTVPAGDKIEYPAAVTTHMGSRAKKSRIMLK